MDYKKEYEAMVQRARELHEAGNFLTKRQMEIVCPQLTESEDEKITRAIGNMLPFIPDEAYAINGVTKEGVWNWLKKQKEQKQPHHLANSYSVMSPKEAEEEIARLMLESSPNPEQKPAEWSEFDKGVLKDAICAADILGNDESFNKSNPNLAKAFRVAKDWLGELPERFNLQPKPSWSEEDEKRVKQLIYDTEHIKAGYEKKKEQLGERFNDALIKDCDEQIAWLKSLPLNLKKKNEDVAKLCSNEWSEKDENKIESIKGLITMGKFADTNTIRTIWKLLDSLRPQPQTIPSDYCNLCCDAYKMAKESITHWKPSEEQMYALAKAVTLYGDGLDSLYQDLKKL